MTDWREASDPACPECGEPLEPTAMTCPHCDASLLTDEQTEMLEERLTETLESMDSGAPTWAITLTGLSLGIAIAPLVLYAAVILVGDLSLSERLFRVVPEERHYPFVDPLDLHTLRPRSSVRIDRHTGSSRGDV